MQHHQDAIGPTLGPHQGDGVDLDQPGIAPHLQLQLLAVHPTGPGRLHRHARQLVAAEGLEQRASPDIGLQVEESAAGGVGELHPTGRVEQQHALEHVLEEGLLARVLGRLGFGAARAFPGQLIPEQHGPAGLPQPAPPQEKGHPQAGDSGTQREAREGRRCGGQGHALLRPP